MTNLVAVSPFGTICVSLIFNVCVAILFATLCGCRDNSALEKHILESWEECPNNATPLTTLNDHSQMKVQIRTDGESLELHDTAEEWELETLSWNRYLLKGPLGEFRITNFGNGFMGAKEIATGYKSTFATLKAASEIDVNCRDFQLWAVRDTTIPSSWASRKYFKWFDTSTKCGFVSGQITDPDNQLMLFDRTGEQCLVIKALSPKIDSWEEVIDTMEHIRLPKAKNLLD